MMSKEKIKKKKLTKKLKTKRKIKNLLCLHSSRVICINNIFKCDRNDSEWIIVETNAKLTKKKTSSNEHIHT